MHRYRSRIAMGVLMGFIGFVLSSTPFEARGAQGGNSAAAKRCKQEWRELKTLDGKSFKNHGQCVSYAAHGGEFGDASPAAACERLGGQVTTEMRDGTEILICSAFAELTPEIEEAFRPHCGTLTAEARDGQVVVVCTPSGA